MLEIWLHRIMVALVIGIGVALAAASLEPPMGAKKPGYSLNPVLAGGGACVITFGLLMANRRKNRRKPPRPQDEEGLGGDRPHPHPQPHPQPHHPPKPHH